MIRLQGVSKRFGEVRALDDVSLELRAGETHCLLGENGAGKSTLIGLLGGLQQPDTGMIEIDGERAAIGSPAASIAHGIGVVAQHSVLAPTMTVLENLMLGAPQMSRTRFLLDRGAASRQLVALGDSLGTRIDPDTPVGELSLGQRQQLEIARALWQRPRVLILDEPTSMLSERGAVALFDSVRELTGRGVAVLFVTHKLRDALGIADAVTVLRQGRVVDSLSGATLREPDADVTRERILAAMFGEGSAAAVSGGVVQVEPRQHSERDRGRVSGGPLLELDGVSAPLGRGGTPLDSVSLSIHAGEVLGVAGIDGNGQRHLAEVVTGQLPATEGSVRLDGRDITAAGVRKRLALGVRYVTDDRLGEGIIGGFGVALNLLLKRVGERPFWRFGFARRRAIREEAARLIDAHDIRTPSPDTRAGTLSGGNIQKILLARELQGEPRVVVFHKPSTGLDLRTVHRVHEAVRDLAANGGAALLISSDLDELLALSHRIVVLSEGRIVGEAANDPERDVAATRARIGELISGSRDLASGGTP